MFLGSLAGRWIDDAQRSGALPVPDEETSWRAKHRHQNIAAMRSAVPMQRSDIFLYFFFQYPALFIS